MIKLAFFDVDDCLVRHGKYEDVKYVNRIKNILRKHDVIYAVATGQPESVVENAVIALEPNAPCVYEMGWNIKHPEGQSKLGVDVEKYTEAEKIYSLKNKLLVDSVPEKAHQFGINAFVEDKPFMLTFRTDDGDGFIKNVLPELLGNEINEYLISGKIKVNNVIIPGDLYAVDVLPSVINKGYGIKNVMMDLGYNSNCILFAGDSDSDLHALDVLKKSGFVVAPANATKKFTDAVKLLGERGYVSNFGYGKGVLDGLNYAEKNGWFI